ncbi:MAG: UDP-N-acetylglucosamine pyrophosphorylase [Clostridiales bacterium]|jgi:UDP-N-acetylglucosamine diphosphorylase/glucosamine-1-phosphate N-acetyltransferase|nr:UDP-N-acetylglucosamine pyrophosphorylase [Clostridiales bacterium]
MPKALILATEGVSARYKILGKTTLEYILDALSGVGAEGVFYDLGDWAKDEGDIFVIPDNLALVDAGVLTRARQTHSSGAFERTAVYGADGSTLFWIFSAQALNNEDLSVLTHGLEDADEKRGRHYVKEPVFAVKTALDAAKAVVFMKSFVNARHMENGVIITDPASAYIDVDAVIKEGAVILPNSYIEGCSEIGREAVIGPCSRVVSSVIGDGSAAAFSVVIDSKIGAGTNVGPFAYIRPNSKVGDRCKIGDFVEVKNSSVGDGAKIPHLSYVGDTDVGAGVNIGCGALTVNYDGMKKTRSIVEDGAFIGCNVNIVSPVTIGEGAYIAAGSTITRDVPPDALAVARERQVNKAGWRRPDKR